MSHYLHWSEKTISDFSPATITALYNQGYVLTRKGKGVVQQTRSLRIDLSKFELSSENKRILKKTEKLWLSDFRLPLNDYHWEIGKMAKNFYDKKFGKGTFSANKVKEILTDINKSNFNFLLAYSLSEEHQKQNETAGYTICYQNNDMLHYSYPFYDLSIVNNHMTNVGMGMMLRAILYAKEGEKKYMYLGSAQRPTDVYKLQFEGLEWWNKGIWSKDLFLLKSLLNQE